MHKMTLEMSSDFSWKVDTISEGPIFIVSDKKKFIISDSEKNCVYGCLYINFCKIFNIDIV